MKRIFLLVACAMEAIALNVFTFAQLGAIFYILSDPRPAMRIARGLLGFFLVAGAISLIMSFGMTFYINGDWGFTNTPFIKPVLRTGQIAISVALFGGIVSEYQRYGFAEMKRRFGDFFVFLLAFNTFLYILYEATGWTFLLQRVDIGDYVSLTNRFRGLMYEGGPFGVMIALFCVLNIEFRGLFRLDNLLALLLVLACTSKAAFIVFMAYGLFRTLFAAYSRSIWILAAYGALLLSFTGVAVGLAAHMDYFTAIDLISTGDANLNSFVFGRVPAVFIIPKMLMNSPFLGVGLGNYSLVRNNPAFRGFLPEVDVAEYHDWGGLLDILVETGIVGFAAFFFILHRFVKSLGIANPIYAILLFIIPWLALDPVYQIDDWIYGAFLLLLMCSRDKAAAAQPVPAPAGALPAASVMA